MKQVYLLIICFSFSFLLFGQNKSRLSLEVNYGLNGNLFVISPDYGGSGGPSSTKFYQKNFVGTIGGIELKYDISKGSRIGLAYAKSVNKKAINYFGNFINVGIQDWHITHTDKFFQFFYERDFNKKNRSFKYHLGLFYLRMNQQEIDIGDFPSGGIGFEERNYKHNKLEEGGIFCGIQYSTFIDTKFELGIKTRVYYLVSTGEFNNVTLTPVLIYHFRKS